MLNPLMRNITRIYVEFASMITKKYFGPKFVDSKNLILSFFNKKLKYLIWLKKHS